MKVTIEVHPADAQLFVRYLNGDEGVREEVVRQLLQQNKPDGIAKMTAIIGVFGRISAGFVTALDARPTTAQERAQRYKEARALAGLD